MDDWDRQLHEIYEQTGRAVSDAIMTGTGITVHGSVDMVYEALGKTVIDAITPAVSKYLGEVLAAAVLAPGLVTQ